MTTKTNLVPFKIRTRKGWIWIENSETGTKGPKLEATNQTRSIPKSDCPVSGFEEGASAPIFCLVKKNMHGKS
jgi:hypothetical protein